jgi:hypothetical protein
VQKLAVEPKEENQAYTTFIIPRERESQLPVILFSDLLVSASFKPGRLQSFHKLCTMPVWVKSCSHGSSGFPYKKWHCSLMYFLCNIQGFFRLLEDHKVQLGVTDLQMGLTTLEEVFLTITKQADLENAAAEGRVETLTVDGQTMNVRPMFGVFGMMF